MLGPWNRKRVITREEHEPVANRPDILSGLLLFRHAKKPLLQIKTRYAKAANQVYCKLALQTCVFAKDCH